MICQTCGKEIGKGAEFCPHCGARISTHFQTNESKQPLLVLKPRFIPSITILGLVLVQVFFTSWLAGIPAGVVAGLIDGLELNIPLWIPFVFLYCPVFFGIPVALYLINKKNNEKTEYRLWPRKLEYYEGFFAVEEKSIAWRNITEVNLRKGVLQRRHGVGTIALSTPATGSSGRTTGLTLNNIDNPDDVFKMVKDLVDRAT